MAVWFCDTSEPTITDVSPSHYQISPTSAPPSVPVKSIKQIKKNCDRDRNEEDSVTLMMTSLIKLHSCEDDSMVSYESLKQVQLGSSGMLGKRQVTVQLHPIQYSN